MPPVFRVIYKLLAAALALLTLLIVVAWVESYWHRRVLKAEVEWTPIWNYCYAYWAITSDSGGLSGLQFRQTPYEVKLADVLPLPKIPLRNWKLASSASNGYPDVTAHPVHFRAVGSRWTFHGFGYSNDLEDGSWSGWSLFRRSRQLIVPYWSIAVATGWFPLLSLRRWRTRRRIPPGHCPTCGYDLRATPNRCPECGAC